MSDKPVPEDLYQQVGNHGYDAGCECDLVGGDPECKIHPPYESNRQYLERIIDRVMQAEAKVRELEQELSINKDGWGGAECSIVNLEFERNDLQAQLQAVTQEREGLAETCDRMAGQNAMHPEYQAQVAQLQGAHVVLALKLGDADITIKDLKARSIELEQILDVASIAFKEHNGGKYDEARERYRALTRAAE